jgi:hypothetical protein
MTPGRPKAAFSRPLPCAPRAIRIPNSRFRLLTEYAAIPKMPVMDRRASIAPITPSATAAMREAKRGVVDPNLDRAVFCLT